MSFALGAGDLLDIKAKNEYVDTIIGMFHSFYLFFFQNLIASNSKMF